MEKREARGVDERVSPATRSAVRHSVCLQATPFPNALKLATLTFGVDGVQRQPACDVLGWTTLSSTQWSELVKRCRHHLLDLFSVKLGPH